jgi:DNA-binding transcriptional MerR regulator
MAQDEVVIPEKLFFKIGEVCDLVGVQAHVLRYWETEFSVLSPQKNKSGQRSYRRRDVEIALKIKQLLYKEMFTIAGARKKLQSDMREGTKPQTSTAGNDVKAPMLFDTHIETSADDGKTSHGAEFSGDQREALKKIAAQLLDLHEMLKTKPSQSA